MTTTNPEEQQQQPSTQQQKTDQQVPTSGKRIIVKNLPPGTTREELRELGDRYGRVVNVELVPKPDRPFGFISFLTEDDAAFTIYRLHEYRYKGNLLVASFSTNPPQNKQKPNQRGKEENKPTKKDRKKPMYSLRTLTPLNPPTAPPQQQAPGINPQSPKAWDNTAATHVAPPAGHNQNTGDNGYIQNQGKGNAGKQQGRRNNNNISRSRGKQNYKQAAPEIVEDVPSETAPDSYIHSRNGDVVDVPITDVHITIDANQIWWHLKLSPEQLEDFFKAVQPFVPDSQ
jgi:hypothetical protein